MNSGREENLEVLLRKEGGRDVWLPPLALVGCVVVVGPLLAYLLQETPSDWIHEHTLEMGVMITAVSGMVLMAAFWGAQSLVARSARLLRIDDQEVEVLDRKGKKRYGAVSRESVDVEPLNFIIRAQSGTFITPVLWVTLRGVGRVEISVDESGRHWQMDVRECEEEAEYLVDVDDWHRLVEAFGLEQRLLQSGK